MAGKKRNGKRIQQRKAAKPESSPEKQANGRPLPPKETRWKPGQSGNPKGRPSHKQTFRELLIKIGGERVGKGENKATRLELAARLIFDAAVDPGGKLSPKDRRAALMFIIERMDGKPFTADRPGGGSEELAELNTHLQAIHDSLRRGGGEEETDGE